jgi:hypothetical protein
MFRKVAFGFTIVALCLLYIAPIQAQGTLPLNCGDIVEVETNTTNPYIDFNLQASAGTTLNMRAEPLGSTLFLRTSLYDSGGAHLFTVVSPEPGTPSVIDQSVLASSNPTLAIGGGLHSWDYEGREDYDRAYGAFTVYVGCTLRDGTVINPGDNAEASGGIGGIVGNMLGSEVGTTTSTEQPFSGVGFPGLPPADFANGITIPFTLGSPNVGAINPGFDSVFGFTVDANGGDKFDLTFTRMSGNLNLGLAVLAPDNTIVYQASLVNAERMNTLFTFPTSGQYTIGVWRIDLLPPATPENTAFTLVGALNP